MIFFALTGTSILSRFFFVLFKQLLYRNHDLFDAKPIIVKVNLKAARFLAYYLRLFNPPCNVVFATSADVTVSTVVGVKSLGLLLDCQLRKCLINFIARPDVLATLFHELTRNHVVQLLVHFHVDFVPLVNGQLRQIFSFLVDAVMHSVVNLRTLKQEIVNFYGSDLREFGRAGRTELGGRVLPNTRNFIIRPGLGLWHLAESALFN